MTSRIYTLDEVIDTFSEGLPDWQWAANKVFVQNLHTMLKEGGHWGHPNRMQIWEKHGDGFVLLLDGENDERPAV